MSFFAVGILVFGILFEVVLTFLGITVQSPNQIRLLRLAELISTAFLSFALVVLYYQQKMLLEEQTELAQKPVPVIHNWWIDGNKFHFELSNVGNGPAKNISYGVYMAGVNSTEISNPGSLPPKGRVAMRPILRDGSNVLMPSEDILQFEGRFAVVRKIWEGDLFLARPIEAIRYYRNEGFDYLFCQVIFSYENINEETVERRLIWSRTASIEDNDRNIEDIIAESDDERKATTYITEHTEYPQSASEERISDYMDGGSYTVTTPSLSKRIRYQLFVARSRFKRKLIELRLKYLS